MVVEEIPILKEIIADQQKLIDDVTDQLLAIKHHFKNHECMYRFDFNILMDESDSGF